MKTIEGKGHLNRKDAWQLEKKTNSPIRYLGHKNRIKYFDKYFFLKIGIISLDNVPKKYEQYLLIIFIKIIKSW